MTSTKPYVIAKRAVWEAYQQVKANRGAAGIDDETIVMFEQNLSRNLYKLWNRMSSGSYFPPPVKQVEIPKAKGGTRKLGIPTVSDRIAQTVVKRIIEPMRTDRPALQRQAPNTWNVSPTYDRGRFSARLGISHNDANIFGYAFQDLQADPSSPIGVSPAAVPFGKKGPLGDTYLYAHTQVDAQGSFRMYRGLQLIVAGLNLTNEVFGFYNGSPQFPIQREYYQPSYEFGLRYTFSGSEK